MNRIARRAMMGLAGTAAVAAWWVTPAGAHISTQDSEGPAGGNLTTAFKLPHGCDGSPTNKVELKIADGVTSVKGQPVAGWTLTTTTRPVDPPLQTEGGELTETTDTLTWTAEAGNALPDDQLQMFWVSMKLPEGDPGTQVAFPIVQTCEVGETAWIEPMVEGEEEPEHPAPVITLAAASGDEHGDAASDEDEHGATTVAESEEHAEETSSGSSDDSDSDDASKGLAIAGLAVGVVGLGTAGVALSKANKAGKSNGTNGAPPAAS